MGKLDLSYAVVQQAYSRLRDAIDDFLEIQKTDGENTRLLRTFRNSLIKCFEFCYEMLWKYGKTYLMIYYQEDVMSPKSVFSTLYQKRIISQAEAAELRKIVDVRNLTTHTYDEEHSIYAAQEIIKHYHAIEQILPKIASKQEQNNDD